MSFQRCTRCVMDNASDDSIEFDADGVCNYCVSALKQKEAEYFPDQKGEKLLAQVLEEIKKANSHKNYDCIMGLSGGLDSSYLAYLGAAKWGLRILAVHIDDGFDTEISKQNIKKLCDAGKIELRTIKPDSVQYNALTLAYMKAGVPNLAVPQDNILFAFLYDTLKKEGLKYFLTGGNFALECILQKDSNAVSALDTENIKDIHAKFGTEDIDKLKFISRWQKYYLMKTGRLKELRLLDYVDYNRDRAFVELKDFCGFEYYGGKHLENILTAFVQLYWLPKKFNWDKRTSHLSSMIVSGQLTREEALKCLREPLYDEKMMKNYIEIIKRDLKISDEEFANIMSSPPHSHTEFKTDKYLKLAHKLLVWVREY
ncbi:MAG: N-acetyl sugar amidotransferase [Acidaminococcaceae bacterium]|nr:N-acetyl sugar amidotransferase [Acidaminococcaceae bacterium]